MEQNKLQKQIIIIGAGPAGIAAGVKLLENNYKNIIILEAENRIGGRIHTIPVGNGIIELGAQWCHGEKNNIVYDMAHKFNLFSSDNDKYENSECIKSDGTIIDKTIAKQLFNLIETIIYNSINDIKNHHKEISLGEYINKKFKGIIKSNDYKNIDQNIFDSFLNFYHKYRNSIEGSNSWYQTSLKELIEYCECDGDRLLNWKNYGFKTILDILMKKYPNYNDRIEIEKKILFEKFVCDIKWPNSINNNQTNIEITCSDGCIYKCDHIIITVSLGVLKELQEKMFKPSLPPFKRNAINGLAYGTVNKIYLEFDKPFWSPHWKGFNCFWNEIELKTISSKLNNYYWIEDIFGFYTNDYQPNILYTWISGTNARKIETFTDADLIDGLMFILNHFLNKSMKINTPINVYRSNWYTNRNFRGSYSFRSITSEQLNVYANDLAEPIYDNSIKNIPILQFAGEATHKQYYSCVHGAIESGFREANRIINY